MTSQPTPAPAVQTENRALGEPTWLDLGSTDLDAAQRFYEELFGWQFENSGEEFGGYRMITRDGGLVGGAMDVSQMSMGDGHPMPSSWDVFLAVDDVDTRVQLAQQHGGTVVVEPHDAGPAGRFAIVLDPTGAPVGMWAGADTHGYAFTGQPGTPVWFELMTQDFDASLAFYRDVFEFEPVPMTDEEAQSDDSMDVRYATNGGTDQASSGICDLSAFAPDAGSFWRVYVCVDNCDDAMARVTELGGQVTDGPQDSPFGRVATIADPAGASFQICAPSQATGR